jgi:hypothetical protein
VGGDGSIETLFGVLLDGHYRPGLCGAQDLDRALRLLGLMGAVKRLSWRKWGALRDGLLEVFEGLVKGGSEVYGVGMWLGGERVSSSMEWVLGGL